MPRVIRPAVLACFMLVASTATAQEVFAPRQELSFEEPEAWAMAYFGSATLLTGLGPVPSHQAGGIEFTLEAGSIPHLDEEQRRVGFGGTKVEDLNQAPVFLRPRARVGLPAGFGLTLAWVPPVEVFGVTSNLVAVGLERKILERDPWSLGARLYGQSGTIEGAFTCSAEDAAAGADFTRNPFGCRAESEDEVTLRYAGLELIGARQTARGTTPYLGVAYNRFDNEFQVDALVFGIRDRTLLLSEGDTLSFTAGLRHPWGERAHLGAEAFYAPLSIDRPGEARADEPLVNLRLSLSVRLR